MSELHITVVVRNKVYVARKRVGHDDHYVTIAEVSNEAVGEKIVDALRGKLTEAMTTRQADREIIALIEQALPAGKQRDIVVEAYKTAAAQADA